MNKRAIGYVWLAPNMEDESQFIQQKKREIRQYCKENQVDFCDLIIDKTVMGPALKRPEMKKLMETLSNYDVVVIDSLSDVGRRFHDAYSVLTQFENNQTRLVCIQEQIDTGTEQGQMMLKALSQIPQLRVWKHERRSQKAAEPKKRVRQSRYNGGACPYGYEVNQNTNQYQTIANESAIVKRIFRERSAGRSLRQIAASLTRDGIKTKRGGRWQANTIKTILENIFYTGIYESHGKLYRNDHEAVISEHLYYQVNDVAEAAA